MQRARINMYPKEDDDKEIYYLGKLKSPITINFKNGVAFMLYPDDEFPELHFCPIDHPDISDVFQYYGVRRPNPNRTKHGNLPIELSLRYEKDPKPGNKPKRFYIGRIQFDGYLDCSNGVVFLAFISDEGEEELQIAVVDPDKNYVKKAQRVERK